MSLVFAGIVSHAPGITGRAGMGDAGIVQEFHSAFRSMGERLAEARPDALVVVTAEHFANFFMNNMPAFAVGMADHYEGPIEDPALLGMEWSVYIAAMREGVRKYGPVRAGLYSS